MGEVLREGRAAVAEATESGVAEGSAEAEGAGLWVALAVAVLLREGPALALEMMLSCSAGEVPGLSHSEVGGRVGCSVGEAGRLRQKATAV